MQQQHSMGQGPLSRCGRGILLAVVGLSVSSRDLGVGSNLIIGKWLEDFKDKMFDM